MENEPDGHDEGKELPLPAEEAACNSEVQAVPEATIEFGSLALVPPEGGWWGSWVIGRGVAEAEREGRTIDHRTAYYVAAYLSEDATPALRRLARTGEIDIAGLQEEVVARLPRQPGEVQAWLGWLADYCRTRQDQGPVEGWRQGIDQQDRLEAEWLRREQVFASLDELFQRVPPVQRVPNAGQAGWHGLLRHEGRPGGWIVSEGAPGGRRVWETDSDAELDVRYVAIVEAQRQWVVDTFGGELLERYDRIQRHSHEKPAHGPADPPDDPTSPGGG